MPDADRYPLYWPEGWQRTERHRRRAAAYKVSFARARDELVRHLRLMGARDVIVSTNVPLRLDGLPYANSREPEDPGVAVYWTDRKKREQVIACDRWNRVKDNLRAVGLAVEALRMLERTGASEILERAFRGFAALPAETPRRTWREVFGVGPNDTGGRAWIDAMYRALAQQRHPDRGGSHEEMLELNRAREEALREVARCP